MLKKKILIDYPAGGHGSFLEFLLNASLGIYEDNFLPFNSVGASHLKYEHPNQIFFAYHYLQTENTNFNFSQLLKESEAYILITVEECDLPTLFSCFFERTSKNPIYFDDLHQNFFYKAQDQQYIDLISIAKSWIENQHLSQENPSIEKRILRDMLKIFMFDESYLIKRQKKILEQSHKMSIIVFPFSNFYLDTSLFVDHIVELCSKLNFYNVNIDRISTLHIEFLKRNKFLNLNALPKYYFDNIQNDVPIEHLTIVQEVYLQHLIEKNFNISLPIAPDNFYSNTKELRKLLKQTQ